jgi:hypothetical protein
MISESMDREKDHERLYAAVDPEYSAAALHTYSDTMWDEIWVKQIAWFYIGFAAGRPSC